MHLVEQYALSCASKVGSPYIYEKYFPLPFDKYITFAPLSRPSKNYDYWRDVLSMLLPDFQKLGIAIVQIGGEKDSTFEGCYNLCGKTSINQAAYLIKRGLLHLGTDTFATHIASHFQKKIVSLYSHSPIQNCGPFWSDRSDVILLESDRQGKKHSYATEENPKTINTIRPEEIACSVFELFGINAKTRNKTVQIGPKWNLEFLEIVPSSVIKFSKPAPKDRHVIRMDYHFNEEIMEQQLLCNPGLIVTSKPISIEILNRRRDLIEQVIYLIRDENFDADFSRELDKNNIKNSVFTSLKKGPLKKLKYQLLNLNRSIAHIEEKSVKNLPNYKELDLKKLKFRSRKFVLKEDNIYPGKAAYMNDVKIPNFTPEPIPILDQDEFWEEMDFFWITETV
jgi:hypothetical protein